MVGKIIDHGDCILGECEKPQNTFRENRKYQVIRNMTH